MKKFFQAFINDKDKELKWYNTNYFYAFTLIFSVVLLICFFAGHTQLSKITSQNNFWNIFLMSFNHTSTIHVTFNVIMFVLLSLILERHFGSFTYFLMILAIIPLANLTCFATCGLLYKSGTWTGSGESCVNCFLFGMSLIITLIYFKQYFMSKRIFLTLIPFGLTMFFFSVDSNAIATPKDFFTHPQMQFMHAFSHNIDGHLAPFIIGIVATALIYLIIFTNKFVYRKLKDRN